MRRMTRILASSLAAAALVLPSQAAMAAWSSSGSGSGGGAAATMPAGSTPVAAASGSAVTVTWPAATFADGTPVAGYIVNRYSSNGSTGTVGGGCAGIVSATSCTEMVSPGTWTYTDTPVQASWTGVESSQSNSVTT